MKPPITRSASTTSSGRPIRPSSTLSRAAADSERAVVRGSPPAGDRRQQLELAPGDPDGEVGPAGRPRPGCARASPAASSPAAGSRRDRPGRRGRPGRRPATPPRPAAPVPVAQSRPARSTPAGSVRPTASEEVELARAGDVLLGPAGGERPHLRRVVAQPPRISRCTAARSQHAASRTPAATSAAASPGCSTTPSAGRSADSSSSTDPPGRSSGPPDPLAVGERHVRPGSRRGPAAVAGAKPPLPKASTTATAPTGRGSAGERTALRRGHAHILLWRCERSLHGVSGRGAAAPERSTFGLPEKAP